MRHPVGQAQEMTLPRYFFDLVPHHSAADHVGTELADLAAARIEAVRFSGQYLHHNPQLPDIGREVRVTVRDEQENVVFAVVTRGIDSFEAAEGCDADRATPGALTGLGPLPVHPACAAPLIA